MVDTAITRLPRKASGCYFFVSPFFRGAVSCSACTGSFSEILSQFYFNSLKAVVCNPAKCCARRVFVVQPLEIRMDSTNCTFLISSDKAGQPSQAEVQADLESTDVTRKAEGIKKCILMILNGEDMSKLLMFVIRYCITVEDHEVKKLLMYFWEVVKKYDASGKLKPEMILVW